MAKAVRALRVLAGPAALQHLREHGLRPADVGVIPAAAGGPKGLILNKTNGRTVASLYGPKVEAWVGQRITLYPATTSVGGRTTDCIRVRPVKPAAEAAQTAQLAQAAQAEGDTDAH